MTRVDLMELSAVVEELAESFAEMNARMEEWLRALDMEARALGFEDAAAAVAEVERRRVAAEEFAGLPVTEPVRCVPIELQGDNRDP